jgi:hypothetical protein
VTAKQTRELIAGIMRVANICCLATACFDEPGNFLRWSSGALCLAILAQSVWPVRIWPWETGDAYK